MPVDTSVHPQSRRALLAGALGGLAAAVAAALGRPSPTSAAAGSPLIIGSEANNAGTADTQLRANSSVVTFKLYQQGPGTALMGYTTPATGATRGVYGRVDSPNGDGVQGRNAGAAGTGAAIRAYGGNNDGVVATTVSNTRYAVKAIDNSGLGSAVWGSSEGGVGVAGEAPSGYGVSGNSSSLIGVRGNSTGGYGVYGISASGYGVRGDSTTGHGVYGVSSSGYAGYFAGALYANSAHANIKAFRIDHPLDPAGKVLMHSCVESNERKLVYDGVVTTDGAGVATVELPAYFGALNRDLRYQLTVVGSFAQAIVKSKVKPTASRSPPANRAPRSAGRSPASARTPTRKPTRWWSRLKRPGARRAATSPRSSTASRNRRAWTTSCASEPVVHPPPERARRAGYVASPRARRRAVRMARRRRAP